MANIDDIIVLNTHKTHQSIAASYLKNTMKFFIGWMCRCFFLLFYSSFVSFYFGELSISLFSTHISIQTMQNRHAFVDTLMPNHILILIFTHKHLWSHYRKNSVWILKDADLQWILWEQGEGSRGMRGGGAAEESAILFYFTSLWNFEAI